jgi:predicted ATP-binding protein involved in virulence
MNGAGKTALLDAIAIGLGAYINNFEVTDPLVFSQEDVKVKKINHDNRYSMETCFPVEITCVATREDATELQWSRVLNSAQGETTLNHTQVIEWVKQLQDQLRSADKMALPLIAYYATGRFWEQKRKPDFTPPKNLASRTVAYANCLKSSSNYKQFEEWFINLHYEHYAHLERNRQRWKEEFLVVMINDSTTRNLELLPQALTGQPDAPFEKFTISNSNRVAFDEQYILKLLRLALTGHPDAPFEKVRVISAHPTNNVDEIYLKLRTTVKSPSAASINAVQKAIEQCVEKWTKLRYDISKREIVASHNLQGDLPLSILSDGVRNMIALVADIVHRALVLNPHFGEQAPLKTRGIVLIDEIELHLHPRWQQTILESLTKAFPNLQFIVTTHSPQVLTTVKPESIYPISWEGEQVVIEKPAFSYGAKSSDVLKEILGVDPRPDNDMTRLLHQYFDLIRQKQGNSEEARQIRVKLNEWAYGQDADLVRADMEIRRQELFNR